MTRHYVFNGDADGLCALQQLRLTRGREGALVTGVKRDIALLGRVAASRGDECTVLDVSLDVNRAPLLSLLDAGVRVRYFDHHFAGELPGHPGLESHIDTAPDVCTSLLVDRFLGGAAGDWALVGAFGDGLEEVARELAMRRGVDLQRAASLRELGVRLNYNAYGETLADLHVPPAALADEMLAFADPLDFAQASSSYARLAAGYRDDLVAAAQLEPLRQVPGAVMFRLPDAAWARRVIGTLANDLARAHAGSAIAIASPTRQGLVVSVRVPSDAATGADVFCRGFPSGGGRRTAAGINQLPEAELPRFAAQFELTFGRA